MASTFIPGRSRSAQPQPTTTTTTALLLFFATIPFVSPVAAQSFPYVPTDILMPDPTCVDGSVPCSASDLAFIFRQTASGKVEFRSLNFSASVGADEPSLDRPAGSTTLPFLDDEPKSTAFGAARTANGSVLVYAGDCKTGISDVWSYDYEDGGEWYRRGLKNGNDRRAPYFLGGTVAFSSSLAPEMDQPTLYTYGGMCETPKSGGTTNWQSDANYTKTMLRVAPNDGDAYTSYKMSVASSGGPRTPIAGFTLTGLTPSMTNKSGIVTQQMSYVLLGGHTKTAFINMSTVAVWNLPAETWSYVNIQAPNGDLPKSDLAIKDTSAQSKRSSATNAADNVYSRSGHTATLSEDGSSIIVIGGWVGDVNTPAEPQLAILEMSEIYSGWQWKIPEVQPDFTGIYGHGAAVLPGNMLMVYGGWETSSSSSRIKRQASSGSLRFYNITSGSWESSYTNPSYASSSAKENDAPTENDKGSNSKRLGLGLGLGFGIAALIGIIIAALCWYKKRRRHINNRDEAVRALSQDPSYYHSDFPEMTENDPWGLNDTAWYGRGGPYPPGERSLGYESMRGARSGMPGLHIPHKPMSRPSRGGYVPTGGSFPGPIHPIYEDEEEENYQNRGLYDHVATPTSDVHSDPFQTPVTATGQNNVTHPICLTPGGGRASATPSPENRRHDPEVQDWVTEVDAAEGLLERMNSRRSQHKNAQSVDNAEGPARMNSRRSQTQGSFGRTSPTRHNSTRSAALRDDESRSGSNLSESARSAAESIKAKARQLNPLAPAFLVTGAEHPKPGSSSSDSYNTAHSSFGALQAEGPSLLMGDRGHKYDDDEPSSPSKSKPRRGWLGSLRRVFSGASTPQSSHEDMSGVRRSFDQEPVSGDYEPGLVGLRGELLRRKKGRQDWEGLGPIPRDAMMSGGSGPEPGTESDWDIERAVEQRLVQVMFTVPRERLRVVNGNEEGSDREDDDLMKPQAAELVDPDDEHDLSRDESVQEKQMEAGYEHPALRSVDEPQKQEGSSMAEKQQLVHNEEERVNEKQRYEEKQQLLDEKRAEEERLAEEEILQAQQQEEREPMKRQQHQPPPPEEEPSTSTLQQPKPSHLQPRPLFHHRTPSPAGSISPSPSPTPSPNRPSFHSRRHTRGDSNNSVGGFLLPELNTLEPRFSHSTDRSSGILMEAQAVPLTRERARTRVLAMVDSFENLSRENSPSPTRFS
uniref:Galactose oxidase n=1 Tax=Gibberella zeae TaxID=5518 RepID=A0A4E9D1Z2_GIBZA